MLSMRQFLVWVGLSAILVAQATASGSRTTRFLERPFPAKNITLAAPGTELQTRRDALASRLQRGVVVLVSGEKPADVSLMRYRPDSNLYYFTGVDSDPAALVLVVVDGVLKSQRLLLPPESAAYALWNGRRAVAGAEAAAAGGFKPDEVVTLSAPRGRPGTSWGALETLVTEGLRQSGGPLFLDNLSPQSQRAGSEKAKAGLDVRHATREDSLRAHFRTLEPELKVMGVADAAGALRSIKSAHEMALLDEAASVSGEAMRVMYANVRPGLYEFELMGMCLGVHFERGASGTAYAPICASGPNACVLHYDENRRQLQAGELVLCDVGSEFGRYASDITRTFPVSGRFTAEQKHVYETVLAAQEAAAAILKPGVSFNELQNAATKVIREAGFSPARVLPHGVSHHIGLDVHDPGAAKMVPGMVITIEPGIYIREQSLGVRIEDMYLVTEDGARCLSANIPKTVAEIEALCSTAR
jgi:Xaa-Pro aminopeptidase